MDDFEDLKEKIEKKKPINKKSSFKLEKKAEKARKNNCRKPKHQYESIILLPEDKSSKGEEIFFEEPYDSLDELGIMNENVNYSWSSSEE